MNRDPMPNEAEACSPYLKQQLELVQTKVVLILGRHALERLMPGQDRYRASTGSLIRRGDIAYVPLYHPPPLCTTARWSPTSSTTSTR